MTQVLSLVVPFYNEGEAVLAFQNAILPCLEAVPDTVWEIVCVDDGSTDSTLEKLIAFAAADPRFYILELSRNFGKEAALTAGIDAARGRP